MRDDGGEEGRVGGRSLKNISSGRIQDQPGAKCGLPDCEMKFYLCGVGVRTNCLVSAGAVGDI